MPTACPPESSSSASKLKGHQGKQSGTGLGRQGFANNKAHYSDQPGNGTMWYCTIIMGIFYLKTFVGVGKGRGTDSRWNQNMNWKAWAGTAEPTVEGENGPPKVVFWPPHTCDDAMHDPTLTCTHTSHTDRQTTPSPPHIQLKKNQHKSHKILSSMERDHLKALYWERNMLTKGLLLALYRRCFWKANNN